MGEIVVEGIVISVIRKPIKGLYLRGFRLMAKRA